MFLAEQRERIGGCEAILIKIFNILNTNERWIQDFSVLDQGSALTLEKAPTYLLVHFRKQNCMKWETFRSGKEDTTLVLPKFTPFVDLFFIFMGILGSFGKNIGLMQLFSGLAPLPTGNPQSIPASPGKRKISSVILKKTFLFRSQ